MILCNDIQNIIYRYLHELNILDVNREISLINLLKEYKNPKYTMNEFLCNDFEPIVSFTYNNKYYKSNGIYYIIKDMIADGLNIKQKINNITIYDYIIKNMIVKRNDKYTIDDKNKTLLLLQNCL